MGVPSSTPWQHRWSGSSSSVQDPVGTHDEIDQIIHTSLLATAGAKVCPRPFSPDKSTVRGLDAAALEAAGFNWARADDVRMAGLQCLLYQVDEPFVQRAPNLPS